MKVKKINGYSIFLQQKLGKGAYGTVYKGQKQGTHTPVAVKVIDKSSIDTDPYLKAALVSQIKIMQSVKSPHIVELFDVMQSGRNYYIIQELCDIDLQRYLKQQPLKIIEQKQAIRILMEICTGFLSLVKQGILHRDLKPANIFLAKKKAKIGDFGFAKKNEGGMRNHTAVGTPLYMSIQLLKGQSYTSKCDIWALGFIFYQMLHGHTPWIAKSQYELINNITNKPLKIDEKFSGETKDFLKRTLGINEDKRICWQQVYAHPIFHDAFKTEIQNHETSQNTFKKILIDIRIQVNSQNINMKKLWQNLGYDKDKNLTQQQFKKFIECLVPKIQKNQLHFFFTKMDINKDNTVSLKQLQQKFKQHKIPLISPIQQRIPYLLKQVFSIDSENNSDWNKENLDHGIDIQLENKIKFAFKKLENTITKKGLSLIKVFNAYDVDKTGQLSFEEFYKIMKKLDSTFERDQVWVIFELIDQDKSKTIQFAQLNTYYSKITGIPQSYNSDLGGKSSSSTKSKS